MEEGLSAEGANAYYVKVADDPEIEFQVIEESEIDAFNRICNESLERFWSDWDKAQEARPLRLKLQSEFVAAWRPYTNMLLHIRASLRKRKLNFIDRWMSFYKR